MRLALISDQHANDLAFRVALEDVERIGVEEVVCLGDVAQGGPHPAETLDRPATLDCETVLGNADALLLEVPTGSPEPVTELHLEVREWTLAQLNSTHIEQIRSFAPAARPSCGRSPNGRSSPSPTTPWRWSSGRFRTRRNGPRSGVARPRP